MFPILCERVFVLALLSVRHMYRHVCLTLQRLLKYRALFHCPQVTLSTNVSVRPPSQASCLETGHACTHIQIHTQLLTWVHAGTKKQWVVQQLTSHFLSLTSLSRFFFLNIYRFWKYVTMHIAWIQTGLSPSLTCSLSLSFCLSFLSFVWGMREISLSDSFCLAMVDFMRS